MVHYASERTDLGILREAGARAVRTAIIHGTAEVVEGNDCQFVAQQDSAVMGALYFAKHKRADYTKITFNLAVQLYSNATLLYRHCSAYTLFPALVRQRGRTGPSSVRV